MFSFGTDKHVCASGLHIWGCKDQADKCCNGWTRLYAPALYGSQFVERRLWYESAVPGYFVLTLVPSDQLDEIERLRSIVPADIQADLDREWLVIH